jgi:hypothetical protein
MILDLYVLNFDSDLNPPGIELYYYWCANMLSDLHVSKKRKKALYLMAAKWIAKRCRSLGSRRWILSIGNEFTLFQVARIRARLVKLS